MLAENQITFWRSKKRHCLTISRLFAIIIPILILGAPSATQRVELGIGSGVGMLHDKEVSFIENTDGIDKYFFTDEPYFTLRGTYNSQKFLGHEATLGIKQLFMEYGFYQGGFPPELGEIDNVEILNLKYNLVVHTTGTNASFRPFLTLSGGLYDISIPTGDFDYNSCTNRYQ